MFKVENWNKGEHQIELIKEKCKMKFELKDLKDGMLVKTKKSTVYVVMGDKLVRNTGFLILKFFSEGLKHLNDERFNIIEVRQNDKITNLNYMQSDFEKCTTIWKRDEDFEKELEFAKSLKRGDIVIVGFNRNTLQKTGKVRVFSHYCIEHDNNVITYHTIYDAENSTYQWNNCERFEVK